MQIEIDFEVWKALTIRREREDTDYNDVLREMLGLETRPRDAAMVEAEGRKKPFQSRGLTLPHGTLLRAKYKGKIYKAEISDGLWIDEDGQQQGSPSAAARAITGNSVNGLTFWEGKRPGSPTWYLLSVIDLL